MKAEGSREGDPVDIVVQSDNLDGATLVAMQIKELLDREFPEVTEPSTNLGEASPELVVDIDHSRAADLGVTVSQISREVRAAIHGTTAARLKRTVPNGTSQSFLPKINARILVMWKPYLSAPQVAQKFQFPLWLRSGSLRVRRK